MIWSHGKEVCREYISSQFICDRARETFEDFKLDSHESSGSQFEEFEANEVLFEKCIKKQN
jgi:hypothetical protein